MKPTPAQYEAYQRIFDYYNERLFNSSLPSILLSFSRKANSRAFFAPEHWQDKVGGKKMHEIALNPQSLERSPIEVVSTIVALVARTMHGENLPYF